MFHGSDSSQELETETEMLLLACLLAMGEGLDITDNPDELVARCQSLVSFIAVESLHRRGFADVIHKNMSLGADAATLDIAKITPAGETYIKGTFGGDTHN